MDAGRVTLGVLEENIPAHRCYLSVGFIERFRTTLTLGGEEKTCIEMEKYEL